eukprot:SAG31_NODE_224_length_19856_cov_33.632890_18_plen_59_part_00
MHDDDDDARRPLLRPPPLPAASFVLPTFGAFGFLPRADLAQPPGAISCSINSSVVTKS